MFINQNDLLLFKIFFHLRAAVFHRDGALSQQNSAIFHLHGALSHQNGGNSTAAVRWFTSTVRCRTKTVRYSTSTVRWFTSTVKISHWLIEFT